MKINEKENLEYKKYTVEDFIKRLQKLPKGLEVKGYKFIIDDGKCKHTFEMGKLK